MTSSPIRRFQRLDIDPLPVNPDQERLDRVVEDRDAAAKAGFDIVPTVYELGTKVNEVGVANLKKSRLAYEALPTVSDGLGQFMDTVSAEQRRDRVVSARDFLYTNDGKLGMRGVKPEHAATMTSTAFGQLMGHVGMPVSVGRYLRGAKPADAAAALINERIQASTGEVKVRARNDLKGGRNAYAIVSPKYAPIDIDSIVRSLLKVPRVMDGRVEVSYDWDSTGVIIDIVFHTDIDAGNAACGEYFKAFMRVRTADNSTSSVHVSKGLARNLCLNFIILDEQEVDVSRIVHRGNPAARLLELIDAVAMSMGSLSHFVDKWTRASRCLNNDEIIDAKVKDGVPWHEATTAERVAGLINGQVQSKRIQLSQEHVVGVTNAYFRDELTGGPDISRAGLINAWSRYAHESDIGRFAGDTLERLAGQMAFEEPKPLLYQYVSVLR